MKKRFILWAQALDNTSPDHFYDRGEELSVSDSSRREEAVSSVAIVIREGKRVYEDSGVLLTADAHHFVIEVPSIQRDCAGRFAPIVCYGAYSATIEDQLVTSVSVSLEHFAKRIGRTVQSDHLNNVRSAFDDLKKKSSTIKNKRAVLFGAGALALLVLFWLIQRNW